MNCADNTFATPVSEWPVHHGKRAIFLVPRGSAGDWLLLVADTAVVEAQLLTNATRTLFYTLRYKTSWHMSFSSIYLFKTCLMKLSFCIGGERALLPQRFMSYVVP